MRSARRVPMSRSMVARRSRGVPVDGLSLYSLFQLHCSRGAVFRNVPCRLHRPASWPSEMPSLLCSWVKHSHSRVLMPQSRTTWSHLLTHKGSRTSFVSTTSRKAGSCGLIAVSPSVPRNGSIRRQKTGRAVKKLRTGGPRMSSVMSCRMGDSLWFLTRWTWVIGSIRSNLMDALRVCQLPEHGEILGNAGIGSCRSLTRSNSHV